MDQEQERPHDSADEQAKPAHPPDGDQSQLEKAQEEAAEERENQRGYQ
jgi:hypothetical protein